MPSSILGSEHSEPWRRFDFGHRASNKPVKWAALRSPHRAGASKTRMRSRKQIIRFVLVMQSFLFLVHLFLYETWTFSPEGRVSSAFAAKLGFAALSVCFICASLLGFRYSHAIVRALYRISAVWLGFLTFVFSAAAASWIVFALARIAGFHPNFHRMVQIFFGLALAAGVYGLFNASWTRVTRAIVHL